MATIYELQQRADALRKKTETDSISPEEVGGLHADTLSFMAELVRNKSALGIRKAYVSRAAMEADMSPEGTDGLPLRFGQLVIIYDASDRNAADNGLTFAWQAPGWLEIGRLYPNELTDGVLRKLRGEPSAVSDNIRNPYTYLGSFKTWTEVQAELDKLHNIGGKDGTGQPDQTKVGEFRVQLDGRNLIVRNWVQNWATGVFTQTVEGSVRWNGETMEQSLQTNTYERTYNGGVGWSVWESASSSGGNMILDWKTDVATTRKQVMQDERKAGMMISYKNVSGEWINEQYVGTSFDDTSWAADANWQKIGASAIELAQELSTEEGSEDKAISQKAISKEIKKITTPLEKELKEEYSYNYISNSEFNGILKKNNSILDYEGYKSSDYIAIPKNCTKIITENTYPIQNALCGFLLLSTDKTVIAYFGGSNEIDIKDYPNASFFRYTSAASGNLKGRITVYSTNIDYEKLSDIEKNSTTIDSLVKYSDELEHISFNKKRSRGPSALGGVLQGYNYPVKKDSRLLKIEVSEGTYQIGDTVDIYTGIIDQLGFFIVDSIFTGEVSYIDELTGNRTITPINDIIIRAGNSIFIKGNKYKWLSPDESTDITDKYGRLHTLSPDNNYADATTPNNIATFVVKLKEIIYKNYVTSDELTEVENKIDSLSQQFILTDRATGKNYKLIVYNGELQAKSLQYDKILCIGNSFTYSPHRSTWLPEEGRGMTASVTSSQYTEMLKISTGGIVDKLFGRNFEYAASNIEGFDFESELPINDNYNAVIVQLGENNKGNYESWKALYDYILSKCPTADIYHVTGWYSPLDYMISAGKQYGVTYIDCSAECAKGRFSAGDYIMGEEGYFQMTYDAVVRHPSDYGFYEMTKKILLYIGLSTDVIDNKIHTVNIINSTGGKLTTPYERWYEDGVVNIRIIPDEGYQLSNITILKKSGETIEYVNKSDDYGNRILFKLPNEDVNITAIWSLI